MKIERRPSRIPSRFVMEFDKILRNSVTQNFFSAGIPKRNRILWDRIPQDTDFHGNKIAPGFCPINRIHLHRNTEFCKNFHEKNSDIILTKFQNSICEFMDKNNYAIICNKYEVQYEPLNIPGYPEGVS